MTVKEQLIKEVMVELPKTRPEPSLTSFIKQDSKWARKFAKITMVYGADVAGEVFSEAFNRLYAL